jgi:hypothetical protein
MLIPHIAAMPEEYIKLYPNQWVPIIQQIGLPGLREVIQQRILHEDHFASEIRSEFSLEENYSETMPQTDTQLLTLEGSHPYVNLAIKRLQRHLYAAIGEMSLKKVSQSKNGLLPGYVLIRTEPRVDHITWLRLLEASGAIRIAGNHQYMYGRGPRTNVVLEASTNHVDYRRLEIGYGRTTHTSEDMTIEFNSDEFEDALSDSIGWMIPFLEMGRDYGIYTFRFCENGPTYPGLPQFKNWSK